MSHPTASFPVPRRRTLSLEDNVLVDRAARQIMRPKVTPADSFLLHAPLELLARATLLTRARPEDRDPIRAAIEELAVRYADAAEDRPDPDIDDDLLGPTRLIRAATDALEAADVDAAELAMRRLCIEVDGTNLTKLLAPAVLPLVGAAAHAPIGFQLLSRLPDSRLKRATLVPTVRILAATPTWRFTTTLADLPDAAVATDHEAATAAVLASVPSLPAPDPPFIWPQVQTAQASDEARASIGALARRLDDDPFGVLATCQRTMLDEVDDDVPYGWTHGLTIPYAALEVGVTSGHPDLGVIAAATAIVAFRAVHGRTTPSWTDLGAPPPRPLGRWDGAEAPELVAAAGAHPDAHVAKYVLASIELGELDPGRSALHLAAAARLLDWWDRHV